MELPPYTIMQVVISLYNKILKVVSFFLKQLQLGKHEKKTGRKLALLINETVALGLFKKKNHIAAAKSLYDIFHLKKKCSCKTLVVNLVRWSKLAALALFLMMKMNRRNSHPVKRIDSTDIPACLFKNANSRKTIKGLAGFARNTKGTYLASNCASFQTYDEKYCPYVSLLQMSTIPKWSYRYARIWKEYSLLTQRIFPSLRTKLFSFNEKKRTTIYSFLKVDQFESGLIYVSKINFVIQRN